MCHFYGWEPRVCEQMPLSKYIRFYKSAQMLWARNRISDIQSSSFHSYTEKSRDEIMRQLKHESNRFLFKPLKDFRDVAKAFAQRVKDVR